MDEQAGETRGLTPAEVATVLRRAAELDAASSTPSALPEVVAASVVEEAGVEAGMSRDAVRQALGELAVARPADVVVSRRGLPDTIEVLRRVPGPSKDVNGRVERYLRRQIFVRQRIYENGSRWAPRPGLVATLRRWLGRRSRHELRPVRVVDVRVADDPSTDDQQVLVRIDADLGGLRRTQGGVIAAGTAVGVAGAGLLVGGIGPEALLVAVPMSGGAIAGSIWGARVLARRAVVRIDTALHGLVDRIEHGPRDQREGRRDGRNALRDATRSARDVAFMEAAERLGESVASVAARSSRSRGRSGRGRRPGGAWPAGPAGPPRPSPPPHPDMPGDATRG